MLAGSDLMVRASAFI